MSDPLDDVLARSRELGFLGPGPVAEQRSHAAAFLHALPSGEVPTRAFDLGSGGGLPGLVLAQLLPTTQWVLLDGMVRRTRFLEQAVETLGLGHRVRVLTARAEDVGRDPAFRATADLVVARAFAAPPVAAECAAPLLRIGGHVVVSEPPEPAGERWPPDGLQRLGLAPGAVIDGPPRFIRLELVAPVPDRFPRRVGVPAKRPLWD